MMFRSKPKRRKALWTQLRPADPVAPKRYRIPAKSEAKAIADIAYAQIRDQWFTLPENARCLACVVRKLPKIQYAMDVHHSRGKIGALYCDVRFWIPVCRNCHDWIDRKKNEARALGLLCLSGYNDLRRPNAYAEAYKNGENPDRKMFSLHEWEAERIIKSIQ